MKRTSPHPPRNERTGRYLALALTVLWSGCADSEPAGRDTRAGGGADSGSGQGVGADAGSGSMDASAQGSGSAGAQPVASEDPALAARCGDGVRDEGEQCDDGDMLSGDGCSAACTTESGWGCPAEGGDCATVCGDGSRRGAEACDDGNSQGADGCTGQCAVEPGYSCPNPGSLCVAARCGDGILVGSEVCDDGDDRPGDGCDGACLVEPGWACPAAGVRCVAMGCGDGIVAGDEVCDDGDRESGDGCSADCSALEPNHACPPTGGECRRTSMCGDGLLTSDEACDDRNSLGGDGCSADCMAQEPGWVCSLPGAACTPARCGDGIRVGRERCDDSNADAGDGCSPTCLLEPGFHCPNEGQACLATTCGDGLAQGLERCDDGNNSDLTDGCAPGCIPLPICAAGSCASSCGDGIKGDDEECDDSNRATGDGCSDMCALEAGFACSLVTQEAGDSVPLPIVYRDFRGQDLGGHSDFEGSTGDGQGLVLDRLDASGKPERDLAVGSGTIRSQETFGQWYRDTDMSLTVLDTLTLTLQPGTQDTYVFDDGNFFPLDGRGYNGLAANDPLHELGRDDGHNFNFTSEVRYWFRFEGDEILDFRGDDDVWVFINGRLAVDIGGVHGALQRCIDFTGSGTCPHSGVTAVQLGLEVGKIYEVVVFQAERHTSQSNYRLTLQGFFTSRSECVSICGDGVVTPDEVCDLGSVCQGGGNDGQRCLAAGDCPDGSCQSLNTGGYGGCLPGCDGFSEEYCGDGVTQHAEGEICDDGFAQNLSGYGGCTAECLLGPRCGDGQVDGFYGEQCDQGSAVNDGSYGGCNVDCTRGPRCGDGVVDTEAGESCDDGINLAAYGGCAPGCVEAPSCGDGFLDLSLNEECDNGVDNNDGRYGGCRPDCALGPFCGDGERDTDEGCDDGNQNNFDGCSASCEVEAVIL